MAQEPAGIVEKIEDTKSLIVFGQEDSILYKIA